MSEVEVRKHGNVGRGGALRDHLPQDANVLGLIEGGSAHQQTRDVVEYPQLLEISEVGVDALVVPGRLS